MTAISLIKLASERNRKTTNKQIETQRHIETGLSFAQNTQLCFKHPVIMVDIVMQVIVAWAKDE